MQRYRIAYTVTKVEYDFVEAQSLDDARELWEAKGLDADLFYIEDEDGHQVVYD